MLNALTDYETDEDVLTEEELEKNIVVFNDDVNTFQHVIESFVEVLQHTFEQAEQCATLIHYKGKCQVKSGSYDELKPYKEALQERGLDAKIL